MKRKQITNLTLWSCNVRILTKARARDLEKSIEKLKPEVLLLQELNLKTHDGKIAGYKLINEYKRPTPGGGVAIYVILRCLDNISFASGSSGSVGSLEYCTIKIQLRDEEYEVGSVYLPPNSGNCLDEIEGLSLSRFSCCRLSRLSRLSRLASRRRSSRRRPHD